MLTPFPRRPPAPEGGLVFVVRDRRVGFYDFPRLPFRNPGRHAEALNFDWGAAINDT